MNLVTMNAHSGAHLHTVDEATHAERGPHMLISKDDPSSLPGKNSIMAYVHQIYTVFQPPNPTTPYGYHALRPLEDAEPNMTTDTLKSIEAPTVRTPTSQSLGWP